MDIDQHVNQIVQNIIEQITTQVQAQVATVIGAKIDEVVKAIDCTSLLSEKLSQKLDIKLSSLPIDKNTIEAELTNRITAMSHALATQIEKESLKSIAGTVSQQVNTIDFKTLYKSAVVDSIVSEIVTFPDHSIPLNSLNLENLRLTGDSIQGGIIQNFGSTGIDDQATACQVTIMDEVTVVENNLLTKDLTVKGTATIEGDLNVTGTIPESSHLFQSVVAAATNNVRTSLDQVVFKSYADMVLNTIRADGLDLTKITVNGQEVVNGNNLSTFITASNLQKLGVLQELQVQGESLFADTMYISTKRVGINTIEPAQALSIWDQEIEVGVGKQSNNTAIIGTPRNQTLVVSSNGKNNLVLTPDGSATVNKINMGTMSFTVGDAPPSNNQPKGSIVFNSNPSLGGPLGWVSLGDAKWANFGVID